MFVGESSLMSPAPPTAGPAPNRTRGSVTGDAPSRALLIAVRVSTSTSGMLIRTRDASPPLHEFITCFDWLET